MVIPATKILEPSTHVPIDMKWARRFPIVVMEGDAPRVYFAEYPRQMPPLPPRSSYLIPAGADRAVQDRLNEQREPGSEGVWVLHITRVDAGRQRIELYWMNDGFSGGGYEATASSITPLYRKITGPGFMIWAVEVAAIATTVIGAVLALLIRRFRQIHGSSALGP
jgi:hypothetical protein